MRTQDPIQGDPSDLPPLRHFAAMAIGVGLLMLLAQTVERASPGNGRWVLTGTALLFAIGAFVSITREIFASKGCEPGSSPRRLLLFVRSPRP